MYRHLKDHVDYKKKAVNVKTKHSLLIPDEDLDVDTCNKLLTKYNIGSNLLTKYGKLNDPIAYKNYLKETANA